MELSDWFLTGLREYDDSLSAVYDDRQDSVHLYYSKSGKKSLAYSVSRETGELYPEMQRRILHELPMKDIWKRFGSGEAYDDHLEEKERKQREAKQKELDDRRLEMMKEDKWKIRAALENARAGRFTKKEAKKFEIPQVSFNIPKEGKESS